MAVVDAVESKVKVHLTRNENENALVTNVNAPKKRDDSYAKTSFQRRMTNWCYDIPLEQSSVATEQKHGSDERSTLVNNLLQILFISNPAACTMKTPPYPTHAHARHLLPNTARPPQTQPFKIPSVNRMIIQSSTRSK